MVGLKRTWLEYGTSDQAQESMVEVGHKQSGSKELGRDRRQVIRLESSKDVVGVRRVIELEKDLMEAGYKRLGLRGHGGGVEDAPMSSWGDVVRMRDERC